MRLRVWLRVSLWLGGMVAAEGVAAVVAVAAGLSPGMAAVTKGGGASNGVFRGVDADVYAGAVRMEFVFVVSSSMRGGAY